MLDPHLGGPENVPGGVERDADAVDVDGFAVVDGADRGGGSEAGAKHLGAFARAEVPLRPPSGVVTVSVRDDRSLHRLPRVDVEIAGLAVQAALGQSEQRHTAKLVRMKLLVLGASGATGGWLTRLAAQAGHEVTALVRPGSPFVPPPNVRLIRGEVLDPATLARRWTDRMRSPAVSAFGGRGKAPWSALLSPPDFMTRVSALLVPAMNRAGVRRVVAISAGGVAESITQCSACHPVDGRRWQRWRGLSGSRGDGASALGEPARLAGGTTGDAHERAAYRVCCQGGSLWALFNRSARRRGGVDAGRAREADSVRRADRVARDTSRESGIKGNREAGTGTSDSSAETRFPVLGPRGARLRRAAASRPRPHLAALASRSWRLHRESSEHSDSEAKLGTVLPSMRRVSARGRGTSTTDIATFDDRVRELLGLSDENARSRASIIEIARFIPTTASD